MHMLTNFSRDYVTNNNSLDMLLYCQKREMVELFYEFDNEEGSSRIRTN